MQRHIRIQLFSNFIVIADNFNTEMWIQAEPNAINDTLAVTVIDNNLEYQQQHTLVVTGQQLLTMLTNIVKQQTGDSGERHHDNDSN